MLIKKIVNLLLAVIIAFTSMMLVSTFANKVYAISFEEVSIQNADFEDISGSNESGYCSLSKWVNQNADAIYYYGIETEDVYDGSKCLRLAGNYTEDYVLTTKDYINIDGSSAYRFGVKFRAVNVDGYSCKIAVAVYSADNVQLDKIDGGNITPNKANIWADVSVNLPIIAGAQKVKIEITVSTLGVKGDEYDYCYLDAAYGHKIAVQTNSGASIRLSSTESGLRFTGRADKEFFDQIKSVDENAQIGMIIVPKDYLAEVGEFTIKGFEDIGKTYLDIPVEKWNNTLTAETDGYYGFSCAIVNIKETNVKREFCAISYIRYSYNGVEKYIYSDFDYDKHARSVYYIANKEMEYLYDYDEADQKIILAYANGKVPTIS